MALPVIAIHTGGLVLDSSGDLDRDIERCVREIQSFYPLSFNPPHTYQVDEYHDLRETMINDVTFGGYHKFGSEARILPGFEETK